MSRPHNISRRAARALTTVAVLFALVLSVLPVAAQEATPTSSDSLLAGLGYPDLTVTTDGIDFDIPAEVAADRYRVVLQNNSALATDIEFYQLPEGVTTDDLLTIFEQEDESFAVPDYFYEIVFNGGAVTDPGQSSDVVLDLTPGEWVVNLFTYNEESDEEANIVKTITVTGEMPAVDDPAGAIEIGLTEMAFVLPDSMAAGPHVWKVVNTGQQPHHLILSQVPDGTTKEQVAELASSFFVPPASPEAGAAPAAPALGFEDVVDVAETLVLSGGQANWIAVDLAPGTYAAICFMPAAGTDLPHVMMGMVAVFTVSA
ncbi:MAG: hypothetical protein ACRDJH_11975 [Thermomicrobiales bacterium]